MKTVFSRRRLAPCLLRSLLSAPLARAVRGRRTPPSRSASPGPLSGGAALYGKNVVNGMEMAIKEINAAGLEVAGKKVKLELVALDDKYAPAEAAINARRLVQQYQTPAVFVPHSGGIYAMQAFNEQEKFIVMAYSSTPKITETGNKLTIRIPPTFNSYIEPFTRYEMKQVRQEGRHAAGRPRLREELERAVRAGVDQGRRHRGVEQPDVVQPLGRLLQRREPRAGREARRAVHRRPVGAHRAGRQAGARAGLQGRLPHHGPGQARRDGQGHGRLAPLEGAIGVLPVSYDDRAGPKAFAEAYRKAYGADKDPTTESSYNYALVHALAGAMKMAGTTTDAAAIRAKIGDALIQLPAKTNAGSFKGVDAVGGTIVDPLVATVDGGKVKPVSLSELMK
jgi:branched-chain amino acid transport system substrate-binding protein